MLPNQISRTSHFGSSGSLSFSEPVDFQPLLIRKNARIRKIAINSSVMRHPIHVVRQGMLEVLSAYSFRSSQFAIIFINLQQELRVGRNSVSVFRRYGRRPKFCVPLNPALS
jgi:hypothetical protein